jgi:cytochrome c553
LVISLFLAIASAASLAAQPGDSLWSGEDAETVAALKLKGNAAHGKTAYGVCGDCHLPSGAGLADGSTPRLAGQHATVIIKQLSDIRSGNRINAPMYPFASELANRQALADVAAYIRTLCIPRDNGKGPGVSLARGEELYDNDCAQCHGDRGEGNAKKFYPVLAGQQYAYMVRQGKDIRDGRRHNANPTMARVIAGYSDADIEASADYISRLQMPGAQCRGAAGHR